MRHQWGDGFYLLIDGKWEKTSKMIVSGFTATWGAYFFNDAAKSAYNTQDNAFKDEAQRLGMESLIYFHSPPKVDISSGVRLEVHFDEFFFK